MQSAFSIFEKLQKGPEVPDEVVPPGEILLVPLVPLVLVVWTGDLRYNTLLDGCLQAGLADEGGRVFKWWGNGSWAVLFVD